MQKKWKIPGGGVIIKLTGNPGRSTSKILISSTVGCTIFFWKSQLWLLKSLNTNCRIVTGVESSICLLRWLCNHHFISKKRIFFKHVKFCAITRDNSKFLNYLICYFFFLQTGAQTNFSRVVKRLKFPVGFLPK